MAEHPNVAVVRNDDDGADEPAEKQEPSRPAAAPAATSPNKDSKAGISKATLTSPRPAAPQNSAKPGPLASKLAVSSSSRDDDDDDEESDDDSDEQMSKSERRRLKKLARREQQRRAA